ncbi:1-acyl-sn-glycerol-3-phosphate acyltransferase [candidate division CSSED10-310 bacterium]|uniref:1-acyl-sn-glycerol-3-phosphate acyltransferase n=1 Tax=candidate division CSSED10-310 bacterium TaxID=2855610 RepID=A0ABV6Z5N8_UNCC1
MKHLSEKELLIQIEKNKKIYTQYYDRDYSINLVKNVIEFIDDYYFKSKFIGFDPLPQRNNPDRPLIYACNHSGMAFPWDAIIFAARLFKKADFDLRKAVRPITASELSRTALMQPFIIDKFWKRLGCIDATYLNFETMMQYQGSNLLMYPEGVTGIGKGFDKRYQLQRFATSFVRMSLKYKTDIIPVATVNGEYINPYCFISPQVNKFVNLLGIPFMPLGLATIGLPFFPWMFYYAWPANLIYVKGTRIKPYEMTTKSVDKISRAELIELTNLIRDQMQEGLDEAVHTYGATPYSLTQLTLRAVLNAKKLPFFTPFGWPLVFTEFERQWRIRKTDEVKLDWSIFSTLKVLLNNPGTIKYYTPLLGWLPMIYRGIRPVRT